MRLDTGITTGIGDEKPADKPKGIEKSSLTRSGSTQLGNEGENNPPRSERLDLSRIAGLPLQVDVRLPIPKFRVADLLSLAKGQIISSAWPSNDDISLSCGDVQLVWTEFEVVDQTLAVRVTRLA